MEHVLITAKTYCLRSYYLDGGNPIIESAEVSPAKIRTIINNRAWAP